MSNPDVAADVELVRSLVAKHFPIYDVKVSYAAVTIMVNPANKASLEADFDQLRKELKEKSFIPLITYAGGEYTISVIRNPQVRRSSTLVNKILLVITFITTTLAGMVLWADYSGASSLFTLDNAANGALFFALPLMAILGVHEYCHYWMAKRHGLEASLPFFIPSVPPFGTFGAFISMRDPMPSRKALVDIGAAGPLGGLAVTIPVALIGLYLTAHGHPASGPVTDGSMGVAIQPLYQLLLSLFPVSSDQAFHPTAFAAWVGFLVTAINLLPAGQLDGGHIARGLLGESSKYLAYVTFAALVLLAMLYDGWLLFALFVLLVGLRHPSPLNDISKIGGKTKAVGAISLAVLLFCFVPQPLFAVAPDHSFSMDVAGGNITTVDAGGYAYFTVLVNNTGNADSTVNIALNDLPDDLRGSTVFLTDGSGGDHNSSTLQFDLPYDGNVSVTVSLYVEPNAMPGPQNVTLTATSGDVAREQAFTVNVTAS